MNVAPASDTHCDMVVESIDEADMRLEDAASMVKDWSSKADERRADLLAALTREGCEEQIEGQQCEAFVNGRSCFQDAAALARKVSHDVYFMAHTHYQQVSASWFELRQARRTQLHFTSTESDLVTIMASQMSDGEVVLAAREHCLCQMAQNATAATIPSVAAMPEDVRKRFDSVVAQITNCRLAIAAGIWQTPEGGHFGATDPAQT